MSDAPDTRIADAELDADVGAAIDASIDDAESADTTSLDALAADALDSMASDAVAVDATDAAESPPKLVDGSCSGALDVPTKLVDTTVTIDGKPVPATSEAPWRSRLELVHPQTGHSVRLADFYYDTVGRFGWPTSHLRLVTGNYDLVLRSHRMDTADPVIELAAATDPFVGGQVVLAKGLSIAKTTAALPIDIKTGILHTSLTIDGAAPPSTSSVDTSVLLVSRSTGTAHRAVGIGYAAPGKVVTDFRLPVDSYDVVYSRGAVTAGADTGTVAAADSMDTLPNGHRKVATLDVVAGEQTVAWNVARSRISGTVTLNGAPLPTTSADATPVRIFLRAKDTGYLHLIHRMTFSGAAAPYTRATSDSYATQLPAGTYDLVYERGSGRKDTNRPWRSSLSPSSEALPKLHALLKKGVVVPAGTSKLDIDITLATVKGNITFAGAPMSSLPTAYYDAPVFWLRAKGETALLPIAAPSDFVFKDGLSYPSSNAFEAKVPPGSYELLYNRGFSDDYSVNFSGGFNGDAMARAHRVVSTSVSIGTGTTMLDIDVPVVRAKGKVTFNGGPLPNHASTPLSIQLIARDTGAVGGTPPITWSDSGPIFTPSSDGYDVNVVKGTYDVRVVRRSPATDFALAAADDWLVTGTALVGSGVIFDGTSSVDLDLPIRAFDVSLTIDGAKAPASTSLASPTSARISVVSDDSTSLTGLGFFYDLSSKLRTSPDTFSSRLFRGPYSFVYERDFAGDAPADDGVPYGFVQIGTCVQ